MMFKIALPFHGLARELARLARLAPRRSVQDKGLRQSRAELAQMSARELNDLGIGHGDIPALLDHPVAWRGDRR